MRGKFSTFYRNIGPGCGFFRVQTPRILLQFAHMISIDVSSLNPLEKRIHEQLMQLSENRESIRIQEAAQLCQCSVSKISKFVKKLGFKNYKQYLDFVYGREIEHREQSDELKRVRAFIDAFDPAMIDELLALIDAHAKVILFGYGPSMLCAQYFEYRFRNCSDKMVIAISDEVAIDNMVDSTTLLLILTETGRFHSFQDVYASSSSRGATVAIIVEEYNTELFNQCDRIFWLSADPQPAQLKPYEKSRTLFFIFLEEIIQKLLKRR
ncbi:MAG: MurR/RpiR family transcriptional regulator, partial [bacterium]